MKKLLLLFAAIMMASTGLWAQTKNVTYRYPVYYTEGDAASGIKEWKNAIANATLVNNSSESTVVLGETDTETWYAVTERKLVWCEEFDGDGEVDRSKWGFEHGFVRNKEYQWYQEDNARMKDGVLVIEARYDSTAQHAITSSSINTRGKYEFLYGQMEVRAKIPAVMGSWPAIWTLGSGMEWPSCGEIDVMEYYQIDGVPHILANAAWGNDRKWGAVWNSKKIPFSHFLEKDADWADKFHVWLMDWTEDYLRIYLDGELLNDIDLKKTINGRIGRYMNPFHSPQYILLNLAIGGTNGGEPLLEKFPLRYEIDYVRVYAPK